MLYVIATITLKPGTLDTVLAAARPCLVETRKEKGCISYDLNQNIDAPDELVFVERWESRAALEAHFKAPHLIAWRDAGAPHIAAKKIEIIEDGKVTTL